MNSWCKQARLFIWDKALSSSKLVYKFGKNKVEFEFDC